MKVCKFEQISFAVELMDKLGVSLMFRNLLCSDSLARFFGEAFEDKSLERYILDFEKRTGCLVYYVCACECDYGFIYSLLCVSNYQEDWKHCLRVCEDGSFFVWTWCWNVDFEYCSEFGFIQVINDDGLLVRIG